MSPTFYSSSLVLIPHCFNIRYGVLSGITLDLCVMFTYSYFERPEKEGHCSPNTYSNPGNPNHVSTIIISCFLLYMKMHMAVLFQLLRQVISTWICSLTNPLVLNWLVSLAETWLASRSPAPGKRWSSPSPSSCSAWNRRRGYPSTSARGLMV